MADMSEGLIKTLVCFAGQANVEPVILGAKENLRRGLLRGGHDIRGEILAPGKRTISARDLAVLGIPMYMYIEYI